ncbi:hypothetical protein DM01DRAFT_1168058 [Hesseltinella vesiculosa]|uniref:Uncharacterized protein n=1 Tax=Hesseltinella vesiculosa TaxID=101127 RepID=A0A1X2G612_9FUNG|nr:hypothetical protein DM01DRAFT_1168058 [Hesseltinella vesiculosa]
MMQPHYITSICQTNRLTTATVYSIHEMPTIDWVPFSDKAQTIYSTEVCVGDLRTAVEALASRCKRKLSEDLPLFSVDPSVAVSFRHGQVNRLTSLHLNLNGSVFFSLAFGATIPNLTIPVAIHGQLSFAVVGFVQESGRPGCSGSPSTIIPPWSRPPLAFALLLLL